MTDLASQFGAPSTGMPTAYYGGLAGMIPQGKRVPPSAATPYGQLAGMPPDTSAILNAFGTMMR